MALQLQETIYVVPELEPALAFYTEVLGFEVRVKEKWGLAVLALDDRLMVIRTEDSLRREFPSEVADFRPRAMYESDDLDADADRLNRGGCRLSAVYGDPDGSRAFLGWDPFDNPFMVWGPPAARKVPD